MGIEQAWLLKGFVLAHTAPAAIVDAVEAVIAELSRGTVEITGPDQSIQVKLPVFDEPEAETDRTGPKMDETTPTAAATEVTEPAPKKRHNWSPEARAAQAERMRARQAAKRAKDMPPVEETVTATPQKPYTPVPVEKLISDHNEYAGKRDPGQALTDEDWPDIKGRLAKNPDRKAIASDYDMDIEDLNFFIASCQRREQRGNFAAPMLVGA